MGIVNIITAILGLGAFYHFIIRPPIKERKKQEIREAYLLGIMRILIHSDRRKGKALPLEESWKYRVIAERYDAEILKKEFGDEGGKD